MKPCARRLNELAVMAPDWLQALAPADWYERYSRRVENYRLPKTDAARLEHAAVIGADGRQLLACDRRRQGAAMAGATARGANSAESLGGHNTSRRTGSCDGASQSGNASTRRASLLTLRSGGSLQYQARYLLGRLQGPSHRDL